MDHGRLIKSPVIATTLRLSIFLLITLVPGLCAVGQVKFTTVVSSQEVGKTDYLQVEFVVENARQIDDMTPPNFHGFRIAQGPIQSSGMSIVNGNMSQYKALSFVLEPEKTGKFTIGGAVATVDGKHMQSNSVTVTVHPGGSGSAGSSPAPGGGNPFGNPFLQPSMPDPFGREPGEVEKDYVLRPGENVKEKIRKNLFVKVQVDKNTCYVGEPIVATYKLYSRLSSESRVTKRPSLNGFSVYDMVDPSTDPVSVEKLNGKDFTVHIIRKTQLIPLQAGSIDLDPVEVENTVHFVKGSGNRESRRSAATLRDLFDQMTDESNLGPEVDENVTLDTKPVTITVKPLPEENKPAGYSGAVGNFSVEASLASNTVAAQDENTLHVVVKGKGNLPVFAAPPVTWPDSITAFDPTSKEDVNKTVSPMTGSKSFDYVFAPKRAGHYTIPAVNFSYFDPASQCYKTAETKPLELQVSPVLRKSRKGPVTDVAPEEGSLPARIGSFLQDRMEWVIAALLVTGVTIYFWRQHNRISKSDAQKKSTAPKLTVQPVTVAPPMSANRTNAPQLPTSPVPASPPQDPSHKQAISSLPSAAYVPATPPADPLVDARQYFENGDSKAFYREINRAIWKAVGKKLDLPASELNKSNAVRHLRQRGWDETALLSLENILGECEMNLYTPAYDRFNMELLLRQTERVIERLA
ncbi:BatD family protein [Puia sp.]|uniref:BatD family protein n=1 Tax=Puia sp. TaxID=2045100 RepID=UPI002F41D505